MSQSNKTELLTVLVHFPDRVDPFNPTYRFLKRSLLRFGKQISIVPITGALTSNHIYEITKNASSKYFIIISASDELESNFLKTILQYLAKSNVYIAEPAKLASLSAKIPDSSSELITYSLNRSVEIYGIIFNVNRMHDLLSTIKNIPFSSLYLNYRLYWGISKINILPTRYCVATQEHLLNGIRVTDVTDYLLVPIEANSIELRLLTLSYVIQIIRGFRSNYEPNISLDSLVSTITTQRLVTELKRLPAKDALEKGFLRWIADNTFDSYKFKETKVHNVCFNYAFSRKDESTTLLYKYTLTDVDIYIAREYVEKPPLKSKNALSKFDFYSRPVCPSSSLLFFDRSTRADDNAEHFYSYMQQAHPEFEKCYFALSKKSADWNRLENKGFKLVEMWTPEFYKIFLESDAVISSQIYSLSHRGKNFSNSRFVYLQHGIQLNDMSDWVNSKLFDVFIVTGKPEADYMTALAPHEVLNSGIPRLSVLPKKSVTSTGNIYFMPTWRFSHHSISDDQFKKTDFFIAINDLINDPTLNQYLYTSGKKLRIKLHPNLEKRSKLFNLQDSVEIFTGSYHEALSDAQLVLTDYSSVVADAAFIEIPIAYYQWDHQSFFESQPYKSRLSYDTQGLGPLFHDKSPLVEHITAEEYLHIDDCREERRNWFFEGVDRHSICDRIYERILSL